MEDWYCCESTGVRPKGFTYYPNVTVCDTCGLKFPYYDCECELEHECMSGESSAATVTAKNFGGES